MLTNRVHVTLQLKGSKVGFLQQKGEIETGTVVILQSRSLEISR